MKSLYVVMVCFIITTSLSRSSVEGVSWCVARSEISNQVLQMGLDYACAAGADCVALQSDGLCFLPNTLLAHASYAFNSYYQRRAMAPGSCDFAGTATIAKTDPSYGSCVYPNSLSTAGGMPFTPTPVGGMPTSTGTGTVPTAPIMPTTTAPPLNNSNGTTPMLPAADTSQASIKLFINKATTLLMFLLLFFIQTLFFL